MFDERSEPYVYDDKDESLLLAESKLVSIRIESQLVVVRSKLCIAMLVTTALAILATALLLSYLSPAQSNFPLIPIDVLPSLAIIAFFVAIKAFLFTTSLGLQEVELGGLLRYLEKLRSRVADAPRDEGRS
jgi:hypothetical protein